MTHRHTALRVHITGRVQGVNFRAWTRSRAEQLGLAGWVRNEHDGSVTALIAGPEDNVSAMMQALRSGPAAASVVDVASEQVDPCDVPAGFRITG